MVVVAATAFVAGAVCLFYASTALRTRRAAARLDVDETLRLSSAIRNASRSGDAEDDSTAWLVPPGERENAPDDPVEDVSIERGVVLLFLGLLCLLFGILSV